MGITPTTQRRAADGTGAVQTVATVSGRQWRDGLLIRLMRAIRVIRLAPTVAIRTILATPNPSAREYDHHPASEQ